LGPQKKLLLQSIPNHLLKNALIKPTFPCALLPYQEGAKQDTIGVTQKTSAKLPHHRGPMPTYPMENKMPFGHHIVER
jgi:hypothetical protein